MNKYGPKDRTSDLVRVPKRFYWDHMERMLPTPPAIKETVHHVWLEMDHPDLPELKSDALYYSDAYGPEADDRFSRLLKASAQKTVDSLEAVPSPEKFKRLTS